MPRRRGGRRRGGKRKGRFQGKRELVYKEEMMEYGQCLKLLGSGRFTIYCYDGKERVGLIRGKLRRRVWVRIGSLVLI